MWHNAYYLVPAVLLTAAVLWASRARQAAQRVPNPKGLPGRGIPLLDAAFLSGGPGRVFDTALVRMHRAGHVVVNRAGLVTLTADKPYDKVEREIVDAVGPTRSRDLAPLRLAVMRSPGVQAIGDELAGRGLLRNPVKLDRARTAHRLIRLALLVAAGFTAAAYLLDSDEPGYERPALWIPLLLLAVGLTSLLATRPPRGRITPAGRRQLSLVDDGKTWTPRNGARNADAALLGAIALGGLAAVGAAEFADEELQQALLASAAADQTARAAGYSASSSSGAGSSGSSGSSGGSCSSGPAVWCGSSSDSSGSSGSSDSSGSSGSSGSSCGGSTGCGGSSSGSGSGCGSSSSSSCGSSCGGGCGS
ncbi:TIGR04222 domain-containing membrane protein [Kitasatospora sp. NPDC056184]|uniref:TIGR04222 domain-containing membrane protein n=1 Tax=Kitasatospora sp. NPDC056184 TaxID=3345738 RepID=UPI0035D5E20C